MEEAKKDLVKGKNFAKIGPFNECKNTFLYDQVKKIERYEVCRIIIHVRRLENVKKFLYSFLCDGSVDLVGRALDLHAKIGVRILDPKDQLLKRVVNDSLPNAREQCVFDTLKNSNC